jgi:hypothetical protein
VWVELLSEVLARSEPHIESKGIGLTVKYSYTSWSKGLGLKKGIGYTRFLYKEPVTMRRQFIRTTCVIAQYFLRDLGISSKVFLTKVSIYLLFTTESHRTSLAYTNVKKYFASKQRALKQIFLTKFQLYKTFERSVEISI